MPAVGMTLCKFGLFQIFAIEMAINTDYSLFISVIGLGGSLLAGR